MVTRKPRSFNSRPREEAVKPFPKELATPPVTKMCLGILTSRLVHQLRDTTLHLYDLNARTFSRIMELLTKILKVLWHDDERPHCQGDQTTCAQSRQLCAIQPPDWHWQ